MKVRWLAVLAVCALFAVPAHAADQPPQNKGLFITPARDYIDVTPGAAVQKQLTLANYTDKPITIDLSVEQFSVANFSYEFTFTPAAEDWIKIAEPQITLQPTKSQTLTYTLAAPTGAAPGGHYFSLVATATIDNGAVKSRVRAVSVLYATVQGDVTLSSKVEKGSVPRVSIGGDIPFTMDVKNTGNTHFFVRTSGTAQGFLAGKKGAETTQMLMPNTVRTIGGAIPAPLLPGIYAVTYGYNPDGGEPVVWTSHIVYVPVWSWFLAGGLIWLITILQRRRKPKNIKDFEQQPYKS